jgi:hypothetical protein
VEALQLDHLAIHWSDAFDAAEHSLAEVSRSRRAFRLSPAELHDRLKGLRLERGAAELDLELLARTSHVELHRHVGPRSSAGNQRAVAAARRETGAASALSGSSMS